jgi:hypothetical protein
MAKRKRKAEIQTRLPTTSTYEIDKEIAALVRLGPCEAMRWSGQNSLYKLR